ncbi:MAG TPA: hypothetical protein VK116_05410, partial [Planctomycetota bacterium]|nr:hypothetical protein [Planctomycetota bacterium]
MKPCAIGARRTETRGATLVARLLAPTAALALLFLNACERSSESNSPETASSGSKDRSPGEKELGFAFHEISAELGIEFRHTDGSSGRYSIVETLASGLALFDFDLDGDLDIYFLNGRPLFGPEGSPP